MYRGEGWPEPCNGCVTAVAATKGTELSQWCTEERRPKPCKGFPFLFSTFCVFGRIRYTPPITPIKSVKLSQKHPCRRCAAAGVCLTAWSCACVCVCVCACVRVRACVCVRLPNASHCTHSWCQCVRETWCSSTCSLESPTGKQRQGDRAQAKAGAREPEWKTEYRRREAERTSVCSKIPVPRSAKRRKRGGRNPSDREADVRIL